MSMSLDHIDKVSSLQSELQLLYVSFKCTEPPQPDSLPDSHLSLQVSALRYLDIHTLETDVYFLDMSCKNIENI